MTEPTPAGDAWQNMRALIARVEQAAGADRRLDGEIWRTVSPDGDWHLDGDDMWMRRCPDDGAAFDLPAAYTASLDAAVSLVPEGCGWECGANSSYGIHGGVEFGMHGISSSGLATPTLALVHAALRARLAMMEDTRDG